MCRRLTICRNERGFVLVTVLWVLAILTVISLGFARRAMLERRMAWYALDREQAQQMARGAAERGIFEIRNKMLYDSYNQQLGYTGLDQHWARPIDLLAEADYFRTVRGGEFKDDVCEVRIEDEERRISVNQVPEDFLQQLKALSPKTISRLLELRGMSTGGTRPALLHSIEELRSMQEIDFRDWYGEPDKPGLASLLTVWGDSAAGRLNINTATEAVLNHIPGLESDVAALIMKYRNGADGQPYTADDQAFVSLEDVLRKVKVSAEKLKRIQVHCKTDSSFFTIYAHASRRRGKINAYCTVTVELVKNRPVIRAWKEGAVGA